MKFRRLYLLLFGAVLAFPVYAQDAGPLALDAGMRAYTTRVFVEPEVLAGLRVGDEVSFYVTYFTAWDYPHAEGFDDTYVVNEVSERARILVIWPLDINRGEDPLVEVAVRLELPRKGVWGFVRADSWKVRRSYSHETLGQLPISLISGDPLIMTKPDEGLPEYCTTCETLSFDEYLQRFLANNPRCFLTVRRGAAVERRVTPCRDN